MIFKNNQQAKEFLTDYKSWAKMDEDEYFDRKRYQVIFKGLKIIAEETAYLGSEYNPQTRRLEEMPKTIVQYYVIPGGVKELPMYSYRESMSRAADMIREADKENGGDESEDA